MTYVSNSRHISLLKQARNAIQDAIDAVNQVFLWIWFKLT